MRIIFHLLFLVSFSLASWACRESQCSGSTPYITTINDVSYGTWNYGRNTNLTSPHGTLFCCPSGSSAPVLTSEPGMYGAPSDASCTVSPQSCSGNQYAWAYNGAWSACSSSCGPGTQTRALTCILYDINGLPTAQYVPGPPVPTTYNCGSMSYANFQGVFPSSQACNLGPCSSSSTGSSSSDGVRLSFDWWLGVIIGLLIFLI